MTVPSDVRLIDCILNKSLVLEPFILEHIQPASIDLTLDTHIKIPRPGGTVDFSQDTADLFTDEVIRDTFVLEPGKMILGQIFEVIGIPRGCNGHIHNRSSLIRLGLDVAAGSYINPGYKGNLPISIKNNGEFFIKLVPGMRICQLELSEVRPEPLRDYSQRHDAKYFGEGNALVSRIHEDKEFSEFLKFKTKADKEKTLTNFLQQRIKEKSRDVVESMPDELKKELGLL